MRAIHRYTLGHTAERPIVEEREAKRILWNGCQRQSNLRTYLAMVGVHSSITGTLVFPQSIHVRLFALLRCVVLLLAPKYSLKGHNTPQ